MFVRTKRQEKLTNTTIRGPTAYERVSCKTLVLGFVLALVFLWWQLILNDFTLSVFSTCSDTRGVDIDAPGGANFPSMDDQTQSGCKNLSNGGPISIIWAWHDPPTLESFESTLRSIALYGQGALPIKTNIYCGSTSCMDLAKKASVEHNCVSISPLLVKEIAKDTPLEGWAGDHVLAKLLHATYFEEILQVAMQLAVLMKYGGLVTTPGSVIIKPLNGMTYSHVAKFLTVEDSIVLPNGGIPAATAPKFHSVSQALMNTILAESRWPNYVPKEWPQSVSWTSLKKEVDRSSVSSAVFSDEMGVLPPAFSVAKGNDKPRHFGTLTYQARRTFLKSQGNYAMNRGDEMQGLGGLQFLPRLDAFVERDRLDVVSVIGSGNFVSVKDPVTKSTASRPALTPTTVFLNAWYGTPDMTWPPVGSLDPIFVAMHLNSDAVKNKIRGSKEYLSKHWPIGARDTSTQLFFESIGVHSVFSACMTMTLQPSSHSDPGSNGILIVDVSEKGLNLVPRHVKDQATTLTARIDNPNLLDDQLGRYIQAYELKARLQSARVVITQRLHVALPAASMGTPVVLIMDDALPGGGGVNGNSRFSGLQNAVHSVNIHGKNDIPDAQVFMMSFDWEKPPSNPDTGIIEGHRNALQVLTMCHGIDLFDSGRKFGALPSFWEFPKEHVICDEPILENNATIHIASAITSDWLDSKPIFSSWLKSLHNSNAANHFSFYFLTDGLSPKQRCLVRWMVLHHFPQANVFTIAMDEHLKDITYKGFQHIPVITQSRLFLPNILPCLDYLLWIDVDAMVMKNLSELWSVRHKLPKCGIAGRNSLMANVMDNMVGNLSRKDQQVPKQIWKTAAGQKQSFNAGVLVLSLESLRSTNFLESVANYWAFEMGGNDQIALNFQCNGTHLVLDSKWNVFKDHSADPVYKHPEEWAIVHMQGTEKPWLVDTNSIHGKVWHLVRTGFTDALLGANHSSHSAKISGTTSVIV